MTNDIKYTNIVYVAGCLMELCSGGKTVFFTMPEQYNCH